MKRLVLAGLFCFVLVLSMSFVTAEDNSTSSGNNQTTPGNQIACTDSEGGLYNNNKFVKGFVKGLMWDQNPTKRVYSEVSDYCIKTDDPRWAGQIMIMDVAEYFCAPGPDGDPNNYINVNGYQCPSGYKCEDGACVSQTNQATCSDSDSDDIYSKGYVMGVDSSGNKYTKWDECSGSGLQVNERWCYQLGNGMVDGQMVYNCPNGCKDGVCIGSEEQIKEQVKCMFNVDTMQKCYSTDGKFSCSGNQNCVADVKGYIGQEIIWKSSCGGYGYTVIDGDDEYTKFDCLTPENEVPAVCGNGICEKGEGIQICEVQQTICKKGEACIGSTGKCYTQCPQDCRNIQGIYTNLNEKFKLQKSQEVKFNDYIELKIKFNDLMIPKCKVTEARNASGGQGEIKAATVESYNPITGNVAAESTTSSGGGGGGSSATCIRASPYVVLQVKLSKDKKDKTEVIKIELGEKKQIFDVTVGFLDYDAGSSTGVFVVSKEMSTCPENCKCDILGKVIECKIIENCKEGQILCPDGYCREECPVTNITTDCKFGCWYNNKCLPYGLRMSGLYCSLEDSMKTQVSGKEVCENNFECASNLCIDGNCVSKGAWQKFLDWFKRLFGKGE